MATRKRVDLLLPTDLIDRMTTQADALGQTRTKFIERAVEAALGGGSAVAASESSSGSNRPAPPRASTPKVERVVEAQRAVEGTPIPKIAKRKW